MDDGILELIRDIIDHEYSNPNICAKTLSSRFSIDCKILGAEFKKLFGYPIHERINMLRIAKAKEYLSDKRYKSLPLFVIENALGFNSRINFYRVFKELTGSSPEEYRKQ